MISKKTKYGLKALTYIARNSEHMVPIALIAKSENIPHKFLESILLLLRKSGFLGSKKGKGGGYYLLKEASDIYMTDVMRILEGPIAPVACVSLNYYEKCDDCDDETTCSLNKLMIQVRDANLHVFRNTTLEDLK
jgi:Rrf2 family protein